MREVVGAPMRSVHPARALLYSPRAFVSSALVTTRFGVTRFSVGRKNKLFDDIWCTPSVRV